MHRPLIVCPSPRNTAHGICVMGARAVPVRLGRTGVRVRKKEGDGATPVGPLAPLHLFWRADRTQRPRTRMRPRATRRDDAWCDVSGDKNYNRLVRLPYPVIDEALWRTDQLYDLCITTDFNVRPRRRGRGSAIFIHLMRTDGAPTAGCIAFREADLRRALDLLSQDRPVVVRAPTWCPQPLLARKGAWQRRTGARKTRHGQGHERGPARAISAASHLRKSPRPSGGRLFAHKKKRRF